VSVSILRARSPPTPPPPHPLPPSLSILFLSKTLLMFIFYYEGHNMKTNMGFVVSLCNFVSRRISPKHILEGLCPTNFGKV
jgi:hypothetical protein